MNGSHWVLVLSIGVACLAGCSSSSDSSGDCQSRCVKKATSCGATSDEASKGCSDLCPKLSSAQVDCLDAASCEQLQSGNVSCS